MSLLGIFGPSSASQTGKSGGAGGPAPAESSAPEADREEGSASGASRTSDASQTQGPASNPAAPVRAAGDASATASSRAGLDGGDTAATARSALADQAWLEAAFAPETEESYALRYAEAEQHRLAAQELLSRIPVPVEALPDLGLNAAREAGDRVGPIET